ncbi:SemiSWEET transporter [Leptospira ilyithenensis]|uniref:Sugar transporter SemiSWEET n=1 Tax=Leptospira ilyithenensis TaxID=2484901 RepID=A0A4R9LKY8_9LEPT|nr:SemiSWEET transporter [Leptospira ilyithenensis]TGN08212.1 hypothetical protein EHS11_14925 [Leptospira ilyithenensis]
MEVILGYIAAICTTLSFLPQVLRVILTKQTRDISRNMYIFLSMGISLWLVYGILISNMPIILANSFTLVFVSTILIYKLKSEDPN